jgi:hypothetical protein
MFEAGFLGVARIQGESFEEFALLQRLFKSEPELGYGIK